MNLAPPFHRQYIVLLRYLVDTASSGDLWTHHPLTRDLIVEQPSLLNRFVTIWTYWIENDETLESVMAFAEDNDAARIVDGEAFDELEAKMATRSAEENVSQLGEEELRSQAEKLSPALTDNMRKSFAMMGKCDPSDDAAMVEVLITLTRGQDLFNCSSVEEFRKKQTKYFPQDSFFQGRNKGQIRPALDYDKEFPDVSTHLLNTLLSAIQLYNPDSKMITRQPYQDSCFMFRK